MVATPLGRTCEHPPASTSSVGAWTPERPALVEATASVRRNLLALLGEDVFESWLKGIEVVEVSGGTVVFSVATKFLRNWVGTHFSGKVLAATVPVLPCTERVDFTTRSAARWTEAPAASRPGRAVSDGPREPEPSRTADAPVQRPNGEGAGSPLDPRHVFEEFVLGDSNRDAFLAARRLADGDARAASALVHAGTGRGKSHLLQAACASAVSGGRRAVYMTAERFMYGFVVRVKGRDSKDLRSALGPVDLVAVDDLQFLQGPVVANELRRLVKCVHEAGGGVLLAADRPPPGLSGMDEATRDVLAKGVVLRVGEPDLDVRLALVQSRLAAAAARFPALVYDRDVVVLLATTVAGNGRDVDGAVNRLVALSSMGQGPVYVEAARLATRDMVACREARKARVEDVQRLVASHYNVAREDILSARRTADIVRPRQVAMYIAKVTSTRSLPEIGRRFGGRDHTTVLHAVRKIEGLRARDKALADEIDLLKRMLTE